MTENLNSHRHAMRILRDLEREIAGPVEARSTQDVSRNTPNRAPMNGGPRAQRQGIPEFFAAGVGEAVRRTGNAVGGALSDFNDWHAKRGQEVIAMDDERKRLEAEYMPQIRAANRGAMQASNGALGMWRPEKELTQRGERGNQYIRARLDDARYGDPSSPFIGAAPPEQLSDEDLMAELEALNGMGGPR